ncbi:MAG TPA: hypothetical protein VHL09_07830 [Dehalococcoidia bacterium]|nr:hypothetical protein [Dehalococcoidia bacterium]
MTDTPWADRSAAPGGRTTAEHPDLARLRRYEPILCFTRGEEFYPSAIEPYLEACSLWVHHADGRDELIVEQGKVTPEVLAEPRSAEFGAIHYLKFIEPLNIAELAAFLITSGRRRLRDPENHFRPALGRLARVGYGSRLIDAIFSLTLLLRGRVPGDAAAAAAITSQRLRLADDRYVYYGRVVRDRGWIVLQYWFFYPFNNWRSGFFGANDHEADWEMVSLYLYEREDGEEVPAWAAYASHDFHGDDLRRHWLDRDELTVVGDHPAVYTAVGSHASYFRRGEYLTEIAVPKLERLNHAINQALTFWVRTLRQAGAEVPNAKVDIFRIPFVDYARGDGLRVGPGQERQWTPVLLDPVPGWVDQYRGLWGLYARDQLSGENAPSGPMYHRDGSVRVAWHDPVGWAGLDKVPTPTVERMLLQQRRAALEDREAELDNEIADDSTRIQELGIEAAALRGNPHLSSAAHRLQQELRGLSDKVRRLRQERTENRAIIEAIAWHLERLDRSEVADLRDHITRLARPASPEGLRQSRWVELWAASSIGLMMILLVGLLVAAHDYWFVGVLTMILTFVLIEAISRRQLVGLITGLTITLAIVTTLVLVFEFFWQILVVLVLTAGLYLAWENLKEVSG